MSYCAICGSRLTADGCAIHGFSGQPDDVKLADTGRDSVTGTGTPAAGHFEVGMTTPPVNVGDVASANASFTVHDRSADSELLPPGDTNIPTLPGQELPPWIPRAIAERQPVTQGQIAHAFAAASSVITMGYLGALAALIAYVAFRTRMDAARELAVTALNLQIVITSGAWIAIFLGDFGNVLQAILVIFSVAVHYSAIMRARSGEVWLPPRFPRLVR